MKNRFALCLVLLFFISLPLMAAVKLRGVKAYGKKYVYLNDIAKFYGMKLYVGRKQCELRSKYSRLVFTYQKKEGQLNGLKFNFLNAPFRMGNNTFVSEIDFFKIIEPIMRHKTLPKHSVDLIMIDPGHGGNDKGGVGKYHEEKVIVLKIARKLRDILRKRGYKVIMTRDADATLSLADRTEMARKRKVDLYISIHANIAKNKSVEGIETFSLTPAGEASTYDKSPNHQREPANIFDKNNARLSYDIHTYLVKKTGAVDRGVKRSRFFVLKKAPCPAVLIETGFLSNQKEEKKLSNSSYQWIIAEAIADAIRKYKGAAER